MFTDTHSHIHFAREFPDIDALIARAEDALVSRQIIVGCTAKDSYQALLFIKKYANHNFYSTLGVHPHNADELNDQILSRFKELVLQEERIVALGEMGLDYFRNFKPVEVQKKAFRAQLLLAKELNVAVVVHVRDAWEDALALLADVGNTKVVLHCFTGDLTIAQRCWERGYHTSFSGVLTYPNNGYLRDVAEQAPLDKILIETDCPYLTPQAYRGKRNEPAFVVETAKELARIKNIGLEEIGEITTQNAIKAFERT